MEEAASPYAPWNCFAEELVKKFVEDNEKNGIRPDVDHLNATYRHKVEEQQELLEKQPPEGLFSQLMVPVTYSEGHGLGHCVIRISFGMYIAKLSQVWHRLTHDFPNPESSPQGNYVHSLFITVFSLFLLFLFSFSHFLFPFPLTLLFLFYLLLFLLLLFLLSLFLLLL